MALQGEGGAEQSLALLALEGSLLGVGLQGEQGVFMVCKRSSAKVSAEDGASLAG